MANQNLGYWRWMLFVMRETARTSVDDSRTTGRKYHPRAQMVWSTHGINAVAPAGGCVVFVRCMTIKAMAEDREAANHWSLGWWSWFRSRSKIVATMMPVRALKK